MCTHPGFLSNAAAGSIPLDQHFTKVQQENISLIETVPGECYLSQGNEKVWQSGGGQGKLQVTSHSHGKPVPGDVRKSLQWLLILLALSSSLSTVASLVVTPNPQVRTWKLPWNRSSWAEMRYPPGKSAQKWVREEREGEMSHKKGKVFFLPLWLTRASCPWHEEDAWCCTCWSPHA